MGTVVCQKSAFERLRGLKGYFVESLLKTYVWVQTAYSSSAHTGPILTICLTVA
jgi:hypothetical protein